MKGKLIFIIIISIISFNCKEERFIINGYVSGDKSEYIYLNYGFKKDSALVVNNKFTFKGYVDFPIEAEFSSTGLFTIDKFVYIENTEMDVYISIDRRPYKNIGNLNFIKIENVKGTESSIIRRNFEKLISERNSSGSDWNSKLYNELDRLVVQNPKHRLIGELLVESSEEYGLTLNQLKELYTKIDTINQSNYSMNYFDKTLTESLWT